jgi:hypothetical protein
MAISQAFKIDALTKNTQKKILRLSGQLICQFFVQYLNILIQ